MNYPFIDVEETFNDLVRAHGGAIVLGEFMLEKTGKPPDFANADYVFHSEKVVADLKCLMDDNSESPQNQAKINAAIDRFYTEGKIKTKEINEETWPSFPVELHNAIYEITTNSIQGRIRKAKKQISETKERLGLNDYTGMLIIVNDGLFSFPPSAFVHATLKLVSPYVSQINCFIFTTANVFAKVKDVPNPVLFWLPMQMEKPGKVDEIFIDQLRVAWQGMVCRKMGAQTMDYEMKDADMEAFWKARNLPK